MPSEWAKIETMKKLVELISTNDVGNIFENIHSMIALVESDGTLVLWNRAFESCKKLFPMANKLADFFSQNDRDQVISKLTSKTKEYNSNTEWILGYPAQPRRQCHVRGKEQWARSLGNGKLIRDATTTQVM